MKCYYCDQIIRQTDEGAWVTENNSHNCPGDHYTGDNFNEPHITQDELMDRAGDRDEMPWDTWEEYRGER